MKFIYFTIFLLGSFSFANPANAADSFEKIFMNGLANDKDFRVTSTEVEQCIIRIVYTRDVNCTEFNETQKIEHQLDVRELVLESKSQKGSNTLIFDFDDKFQNELQALKEEKARVFGLAIANKWKGKNWIKHNQEISRATMRRLNIKTTKRLYFCKGNSENLDSVSPQIPIIPNKKNELIIAFEKVKLSCN